MALTDQPYFPFYVKDWRTNDKLSMVSAEAHGVMINVMCLMHKSNTYGKILLRQKFKQNTSMCKNFAEQLAKVLPFAHDELHNGLCELVDEQALTIEGDELICTRMVRDAELSKKRALAGQSGGKSSQKNRGKFAKANSKAKEEQNTVNANAIVNASVNVDVNESAIENEQDDVVQIAELYDFDTWWEMYDKRINRKRCVQLWNKLKEQEKQEVFIHTPKYVDATPDKEFRKHPSTYLNQRSWEDEIIENKIKLNGQTAKGGGHSPTTEDIIRNF